jgi:hypothetical protein
LGNTNVLLKADFRLLCVTDSGQERLFVVEKPLLRQRGYQGNLL